MDNAAVLSTELFLNGTKRTCYYRKGSSDEQVLEHIFNGHCYDLTRFPCYQGIEAAFNARKAEGKTPLIIDAGANIGISSVFFSMAFPGSKVFAIEPAKSNYDLMVENT